MNRIAEKIIEVLKEDFGMPDEFGINMGDSFSYIVDEMIDVLHTYVDDEIEIRHGVSKLVIIHPDMDCVIKLPFNGQFFYDYDNEDEFGEDVFEEFQFANGRNGKQFEGASNWNYCENEMLKYELAKEEGLDFLFPKLEIVDYMDDCPIYIQEKVESYYDVSMKYTPSDKSYTSASEKHSCWLDTKFVALMIDNYGDEVVDHFLSFIKDADIEDDLHDKNVGFLHGKPIILDWAGYRD